MQFLSKFAELSNMRYMRDWKENSGQYHEKRGTSPSEDKQWWGGRIERSFFSIVYLMF